MDLLTQLEESDGCTITYGLSIIWALIRTLLALPYPNLAKQSLKQEYDFIVVGAGTAGCVVASRLSENHNWNVLLVEAGGDEPGITRVPGLVGITGFINTNIEWGYKIEPHREYYDGKSTPFPRGRAMGGCDAVNDMWYMRSNRRLYDEMTKRGIEGWTYDEMLPYYKKRSDAREIQDGKETDMSVEKFPFNDINFDIIQQAYREVGILEPDKNGDHFEGYKTTSKNGERISSNRLFVESIRSKSPNLHVSTETFATKVVFDPATKTATGVEIYITEGGKREKVEMKARKEVIVCCGVIDSPKLLQLSGIGPKKLLKPLGIPIIKDLQVGYNFMNHPAYSGSTVSFTSTSKVPRDCNTIRKDIQNYLSDRSGPFTASGASVSYLLLNSSFSTKEFPDLIIAFFPYIAALHIEDQSFSACYYDRLRVNVMNGPATSTGSVVINSTDPFQPPVITLGYLESESDRIAEGLVMTHKIVNSEVFKRNGIIADSTPDPRCKHKGHGSYDYWKCSMKGRLEIWTHGISTCSMGAKGDPLAVVDSRCKVVGVDGLRVMDASIIPVNPNVSPNGAIYATAERCVAFLTNSYA